jgi:hypothetical protein
MSETLLTVIVNDLNSLISTKVDKTIRINNKSLNKNIQINKNDIGLNNVDNTSDINKPISIAQQSALNNKVDKNLTINNKPLTNNILLNIEDIGNLSNVNNTSDLNKPISIAQQAAFDLKVDKTITINGYNLNNNILLTKNDLELDQVNNTSDLDKPVSNAVQSILDTLILTFNNSNILIENINSSLSSLVPNTRKINVYTLDSDITLTKSDVGLSNVDNTSDMDKPVSTAQQASFNYIKSNYVPNTRKLNNYTLDSDITLIKSDVGLSNVDNTSDINKPVSTAQQTALNLKVDKTTTVNGYNLSSNINLNKSDVGLSNVDNTSDTSKPVSTQQQTALNLKVDKTTTVNGYNLSSNINLNKSDVGLSNVDNTSDTSKPVSIPQQTALNLKVDKTTTVNGYNLSSNINLNKSDVGLSNVDNTSDTSKPVSTPQQTALNLKENTSNKNIANGYAGLDATGKLFTSQMPITGLKYLGVWNANTNTPVITSSVGSSGNYYKVSVNGNTNIDGLNTWNIGDWIIFNGSTWDKIDNSELVNSVNGYIGSVVLTKSDVGLSNVDNTSDINKPVSTAQQTALNLKQNTNEKGVANGYASLDSSGLIPSSQLRTKTAYAIYKNNGINQSGPVILYFDSSFYTSNNNILDNNLNQTARVRIRGNLNPGIYIMTIATPGRSSDYNIGRYLDIYKISSSTDNGSTWSNVIPDLYPEMLTTICPRVLSLSVSNDTVYRVSWNGVSGGFGFVTDPEPYIIIEGPY